MKTVFLLLVIYQLKHFLADYPLQGQYMLGKFKSGREWILPLLAHSGVHAAMTGLIALFIKPKLALPLALLDGTIHFTMDRIKASPSMLGRYKALAASEFLDVFNMSKGTMPKGTQTYKKLIINKINWAKNRLRSNTLFWWSLGLDQAVHHLTHYLIIWILVKGA